MNWASINDGVDLRREGSHGLFAEVGPNWPSGWTWTVLHASAEGIKEVEWGNTEDKASAITQANEWIDPVHSCNDVEPRPVIDCTACTVEGLLRLFAEEIDQ